MRKLLVWYIPQAALFALGIWLVHSEMGRTGEPNMFAGVLAGALLAAAYTGGANLVMSLWGRWQARGPRSQ